MANLTITVPDKVVPRLVSMARDSLLTDFNIDSSSYTDAQAVRKWTRETYIQAVASYEAQIASMNQREQVEQDLGGIE
jgi:hypothetical protein